MSHAPQLWTKHRGIALGIAPEWRIPGMDPDDVRQEALVALWEAARDHDKAKGPFPPFARLVIKRRLRDRLQAATRQKRTAMFDHDTEPVGPPLEDTVIQREQLTLFLAGPKIEQRRRWRENKRKQRAAA
jgi:DNA-directed RNA polymerase specialized sigma24 family protein